MTLFKQMALALSLMIITILGSVMVINYKTAKEDMVESLYQTTVNNISSLTNKIAQTGGEPVMITSVIDSEFDSGYYKRIEFTSNDASFSYKQEDNDPIEGVPAWFIDFADIHLKPVKSDVTSGWNIIGKVTVEADTAIVYEALYQTFTKLLYLFVIFATISLSLLSIMLHFILKPLKRIQHQAEAILNNEFVIETKEPYTTEFKEVSHAMNAMVKKVEEIFNKANEAAQRNRELLYNDPVTKLFNRRYLMLKLPELLQLETKNDGGCIMLIALSGAEILNKQLGRKEADAFFCSLADIFKEESKSIDEHLIARVNGTEFTLMLPDCESFLSESISRNIFESFLELADEYDINTKEVYINIGIYRYRPDVSISDLLTRADDALIKAKADEQKNIYVYEENNHNALPKEEWRAILEESIEKNYFSLKFWATMDTQTKEINHKVMTFTIDGGKDKHFYYGDFIAPAINLGLVGKMYLVALKNLLTIDHPELKDSICSIRLSNEFLKDTKAFDELSTLFYLYAKKLNFKLYFEVSDSFALHNTATVKGFVDLFRKYNFGFGINAFTGESSDFNYLKELNPEFIKADVTFLLDQTEESMNALEVVTKSLGIEIIASFVKDQEELAALQKLHIYKVQGPITDSF
ncbi:MULTISPECIES: LapD/MoxY N-terminal periplasmic domain-containing protein [Sulfurimonas]|uniref:bifunctional diguanylate cyclase/phosphodiesterase n=1 Tax=Sulfurimonas TaxID=202746 RepID=UPI00165FC3C2|nr:LapD/MoxY N-terminal periplasmic domain-containing protein [Sulfurimonas indica]